MTDKEQAAQDAGIRFAMDMIKQIPRDDKMTTECHITGVLIVFWGALWGTAGTEFARGFIESQLRGMDPDVPHEKWAEPVVQ